MRDESNLPVRPQTPERQAYLEKKQAEMHALYDENRQITDGNYDRSLAVKCVNGTFVGRKSEGVIDFKGIPFVGKQPVGEYRWKAPVDFGPDDGVYEAYYNAKSAYQMLEPSEPATLYYHGEDCLYLDSFPISSIQVNPRNYKLEVISYCLIALHRCIVIS